MDKKIIKNFEEYKTLIFISLVGILLIVLILYFNPYQAYYKKIKIDDTHYMPENKRVKICTNNFEINRQENNTKIKICQEENCINGIANKKILIDENEILNKKICIYSKIKKIYKNPYLEIEFIREEKNVD
jgi:hypothetical protein